MHIGFIVLILVVCVIIALVIAYSAQIWKGGYREVFIDDDVVAESKDMIDYVEDLDGTTKQFDTKNRYYVPPSSDKQIQQILDHGNVYDITHMLAHLARVRRSSSDRRNLGYMQWILKGGKKDSEIFSDITKNWKTFDSTKPSYRDHHHAEALYRIIHWLCVGTRKMDIKRVLDIGCGNGNITSEIKKIMHLDRIDCVEVEKTCSNPDVSYSYVDPAVGWKLPYEDGTFDIVMMVMSLHHIKNADPMLDEITRVMKPDGVLLLKEHDSWTAFDAMLIDIEHSIYLYADHGKIPEDYYTRHFNYWAMNKILGKHFTWWKGDYLYQDIKNELRPDRIMWGVYLRKSDEQTVAKPKEDKPAEQPTEPESKE